MRILAWAVMLVLCLGTTLALGQTRAPADRDQLERKLTSTSTLIENSSAAKQIEASGVPDAAAQRAKARELHSKAREALRAGQLEAAAKLVDDASRTMFEAVRLAAPEQVGAAKQRADFDARMQSTRALLEAQKRIASEKNAGGRDLSQRVESMIAEAGQLAQAGKMTEARRTIDQGYLTVKAAIGNLREGDTVVRSLNFANKADEYAYEVDRNDTHRMLVQLLLKEKRGTSASLDAQVDEAVAAAAKLRVQAEEQAAKRDHDTAVRTLEQSTRELVKAIRAAGVYIPG